MAVEVPPVSVCYQLDTNRRLSPAYLADVRRAYPEVRIISRGLFEGATDAGGNVPQPVEDPLDAQELKAILAAGFAFQPYANNFGSGDLDESNGPAAVVAPRKMAEIAAALDALGYPADAYFSLDWEAWAATKTFVRLMLAAVAGSKWAGSGIVYGSIGGGWRGILTSLQDAGDGPARRAIQWLAEYPEPAYQWQQGDALPGLPDWAGASTFGQQFAGGCLVNGQTVDMSVIRTPLLVVGAEGILLPDGSVGDIAA